MLLGGIVLGLIAGLVAGGRLGNLLAVRLRWTRCIFVALAIRFGTEVALDAGRRARRRAAGAAVGRSRTGSSLVALWVNRGYPGIGLAFVGIL